MIRRRIIMSKTSNLIIIEKILNILNEMATSRDNFGNILRGLLRGALGEYACITISKEIGVPDNWSHELGRLTSQIFKYMDSSKKKTKFKDRERVLLEVFEDVSVMQDKILYAKNHVTLYYPKKRKQIMNLDLDCEVEFKKMIKDFLPKYVKLLDQI